MNEMIERVARAIAKESCGDENHLDDRGVAAWQSYLDSARAAIAAMREPDDGMLEKGVWQSNHYPAVPEHYVCDPVHRFKITCIYRAMIDEALR